MTVSKHAHQLPQHKPHMQPAYGLPECGVHAVLYQHRQYAHLVVCAASALALQLCCRPMKRTKLL
jgi:hypothetical protein